MPFFLVEEGAGVQATMKLRDELLMKVRNTIAGIIKEKPITIGMLAAESGESKEEEIEG